MYETKKDTSGISAERGEFQSPREMLTWVVNRFEGNEMPHNIKELREVADSINIEGREQGFQSARVYVDTEGRLLTVARKEGDEPGLRGKTSSDKTCRVSVDSEVMEFTLPPELQGDGTMQFMSGARGGVDCIYDLGKYRVAGGENEGLPESLQVFVARYGDDLVLSSDALNLDYVKSERDRVTKGVGLSTIEDATRRRLEHLKADEEEAYEIEYRAQEARKRVKKGLFVTAQKHAQLQDEAYRRVTKYPNIDKY